ncbi:MAG: hypothetical protein ABEK59_04700 [Halobacteria archaeon]
MSLSRREALGFMTASIFALPGCISKSKAHRIGDSADINGVEANLTKYKLFEGSKLEVVNVSNNGVEKDRFSFDEVILVKFSFENISGSGGGNLLPQSITWDITKGAFGTAGGGSIGSAKQKKYIANGKNYPSYFYRADQRNYRLKPGQKLSGWIPFKKPKPSEYDTDKINIQDIKIVVQSPVSDNKYRWILKK